MGRGIDARGFAPAVIARTFALGALVVVGALGVLAPLTPVHAQPASSALPAGDGRDIVAVACVQCHSANAFMQLREGPDGWRFQVYDMILRGAQVRPSEIDQVVNYLSSNFGPGINVPAPLAKVSLPEGSGRELVEQRCSICHGLDRVAAAPRTPVEWDAVVARMTFLGAPAAGDDGKRIRAYLQEKFGAN